MAGCRVSSSQTVCLLCSRVPWRWYHVNAKDPTLIRLQVDAGRVLVFWIAIRPNLSKFILFKITTICSVSQLYVDPTGQPFCSLPWKPLSFCSYTFACFCSRVMLTDVFPFFGMIDLFLGQIRWRAWVLHEGSALISNIVKLCGLR